MTPVQAPALHSWRRSALTYLTFIAAGIAFRLPPLANAEQTVTSDSATVGLQAMHLFDGGLLLWGTKYQGILDSVVTAAALRIFPRPELALVAGAVAAHLLMSVAMLSVLRRVLSPATAFVAAAAVLLPAPVLNTTSYLAPRAWAYALAVAALSLGEAAMAAAPVRRQAVLAGAAGATLAFGYYADLIVVLFLVGSLAHAACCVWALPKGRRPLVTGAALFGFFGVSLLRYSLHMRALHSSETGWFLPRQWPLFLECLPIVLGWDQLPTWPARAIGWAGMTSLALGVAAGSAMTALGTFRLLRRPAAVAAPSQTLRLGLCGGGWVCATVGAFLLSSRAYDVYAVRYLATAMLGLPLLATPALRAVEQRGRAWASLLLALPLTLESATTGWLSYGDLAVFTASPGGAAPAQSTQAALLRRLSERGVTTAVAGYWVSYRLTYLWGERIIVAPLKNDRYPPYRAGLATAKPSAALFHPDDSQMHLDAWLAVFRDRGWPVERFEVGEYTVLLSPEPLQPVIAALGAAP